MFLFIFLLPAAQAILFCLAIGRDPTFLKMAIVNDELDPSQGRVCNYTTGCSYSMFSCRYLRFIDNTTIVQVHIGNGHFLPKCLTHLTHLVYDAPTTVSRVFNLVVSLLLDRFPIKVYRML